MSLFLPSCSNRTPNFYTGVVGWNLFQISTVHSYFACLTWIGSIEYNCEYDKLHKLLHRILFSDCWIQSKVRLWSSLSITDRLIWYKYLMSLSTAHCIQLVIMQSNFNSLWCMLVQIRINILIYSLFTNGTYSYQVLNLSLFKENSEIIELNQLLESLLTVNHCRVTSNFGQINHR